MDTTQDTATTEPVCTDDLDTDHWELCSAVKVDVSEVSVVSDYKVLVVSHDSTAKEVISSLLRKLRLKELNTQAFVIQAELLTQTEVAVLQFEDNDKLMHAYNQFPKGSLSFYLRRKMETSEKVKRDADKASLNGHQLTIQRIRRSLEKLKRKSTAVSAEKQSRDSQPSSARRAGPGDTTRQGGVKTETDPTTHLIKADELYKEPRREHRGRQGRPRKHQSDVTTPRSDKTLVSSESLHHREVRGHGSSRASQPSLRSESMYQFQGSSYKTTTLPQGGTMVSMDTDCMIFYDNTSDVGSIHSMPVPTAHNPTRAHVMPHLNHKSDFNLNKHAVMIDKPQKMSFRNLEDSGIDVKSPPQVVSQQTGHIDQNGMPHGQGSVKERQSKVNTCDTEVMNALNSQNSYLSPTLSDSSPFSLSGGIDGHVKRSGSFSSMKSLPVTMYKDNSTPNSFTFETIDQRDELRSKSQSCTNLTRTKVVRRRSLPPLDVSQEKLEQKKTSLSKRLARKINRYRENEKRYPVLPSPHSFTPQNPKKDPKQLDPDDMSLADMEVAHILEGKPEHPTDSDVEDYLACVESAEPASPSKSAHKKSQQSKQPTAASQQQSGDHMEQSGYYRYRNSAKLDRQQKQDSAELVVSESDHHKKEATQKAKPESLNKFVDQSMKSFLHHCHDINMVSKHDSLELHQAALHGVLPTSPLSKAQKPSKTSAHSPTKSTDYQNPVKTQPSHSPTKSNTGALKPTQLYNTIPDPQSHSKAPLHQNSGNTVQSSTKQVSHRSPVKSSPRSPVKSSVSQCPTTSSLHSPTKLSHQSPTKLSGPLSPNRYKSPLSPSHKDTALTSTKLTTHFSTTKTSMHSPTGAHNPTRASGYSSSVHIHGNHAASGGHHHKPDTGSKANHPKTEVQVATAHKSDHVTHKTPTDTSHSARNMSTTAQKSTVSEKPSGTWSKMYGVGDEDDDDDAVFHQVQNIGNDPQWQGTVSDVPDGAGELAGSASKGGQAVGAENDHRESTKTKIAFNSTADSYQGKSDGDMLFTKVYGELGPNTEVVTEASAGQCYNGKQKQAGRLESGEASLPPATSVQDKLHVVQSSISVSKHHMVPVSDTSLCGQSPGTGVSSTQVRSEVSLSTLQAGKDSDCGSTWSQRRGRRGSQTSDSTSQSSRDRPPHPEDSEETVLKSLSLFSLVLSHGLWSVYLEKTAGQSYGIRVRRGEFSVGRQAWHEEEVPVYTVVQVTELLPDSPAQASKGKLLPGDIIVEVNGHSVLQSSDKVVRTLLDARPSLQLVVARPRHREQPDTGDSLDILNLTFDNMEHMPADLTAHHNPSSADQRPDRSRAYQTVSIEGPKAQHSGGVVSSDRAAMYGVEEATFLL